MGHGARSRAGRALTMAGSWGRDLTALSYALSSNVRHVSIGPESLFQTEPGLGKLKLDFVFPGGQLMLHVPTAPQTWCKRRQPRKPLH